MSLPVRPASLSPDLSPPLTARSSPRLPSAPLVGAARAADGDDALFDLRLLVDVASFPLRAVRRHRWLTALVFLAAIGATAAAVLFLPRSYLVETRILAQRNVVMPALNNPRRSVPAESDAPTRLAAEAVLSRANLVDIVRQTGMLPQWALVISPLGRVRVAALQFLHGPLSEQERIDALVGMLQKRITVVSNDGKDSRDGTLRISVLWPDPRMGLRIVQAAQQNFIEQRHTTEVSLIGESIGILESHVTSARATIDEALTSLRAATPTRVSRRVADPLYAPRPAPTTTATAESEEAVALRATLAAKRATITDLENSRTRRIAALQTQLAELRSTYGAAHPDVVTVQEGLQALTNESPQLVALRAEERGLRARLMGLGASEAGEQAPVALEPILARAALERLAPSRLDTLEDPTVTYAKSRLKIAIANYEDLLDRLESARIELETARAAFKYRYSVIVPPEAPKQPTTPNVPRLIAMGLVLGVFLCFFLATMLDLLSGRLLERWQVEHHLRLPVIGVVPSR
jgi:uncharacterized protein involved in exopolysaccharide biosynthesis